MQSNSNILWIITDKLLICSLCAGCLWTGDATHRPLTSPSGTSEHLTAMERPRTIPRPLQIGSLGAGRPPTSREAATRLRCQPMMQAGTDQCDQWSAQDIYIQYLSMFPIRLRPLWLFDSDIFRFWIGDVHLVWHLAPGFNNRVTYTKVGGDMGVTRQPLNDSFRW